jgi:hypothetical protein
MGIWGNKLRADTAPIPQLQGNKNRYIFQYSMIFEQGRWGHPQPPTKPWQVTNFPVNAGWGGSTPTSPTFPS